MFQSPPRTGSEEQGLYRILEQDVKDARGQDGDEDPRWV